MTVEVLVLLKEWRYSLIYIEIYSKNIIWGGNNSNNIGIRYRGKMYATLYSDIKKITPLIAGTSC